MTIFEKFMQKSGMAQIMEVSRRGNKEKYLVKCVKSVCNEYDENLAAFLFQNTATKRIFHELIDENYDETLYEKFVIVLAMQLKHGAKDVSIAIRLAKSILTLWFGKYNTDFNMQEVEEVKLASIISDEGKLYEAYFNLFHNDKGKESIRIVCPNSKEIIVRLEFKNGVPAGFVLLDFDYYLLKDEAYVVHLKRGLTDQRKEWLDFEGNFEKYPDLKEIWVH